MTEAELRSLFQPFGTVDSVSLVTDRDTGRSRGFGFVEMANKDEAAKAIAALHGQDSGGRPLTVNEARPKVSAAVAVDAAADGMTITVMLASLANLGGRTRRGREAAVQWDGQAGAARRRARFQSCRNVDGNL